MSKKKGIIIYIIASLIWIFGTNYLVLQFVPSSLILVCDRIKEIIYVMVTSLFFYLYVKKTEELTDCKREEKHLSTLIDSMVDFVSFKDGDGRWIRANKYGREVFQLENVDYVGKKDFELAEYSKFYADSLNWCTRSDEQAWQNRQITRMDEVIPLPNGDMKTFDTIKVPLFHEDGTRQGLVIIGRDITEQVRIKKLLEESKQQYKSLFEYSPDITYMLDLDGHITKLNHQSEIIIGFKREDIIGKNIQYLLPKKYKKHVKIFIAKLTKDNKPIMHEIEIRNATGSFIILQCTSLPIIVDGRMTGIIGYGKDVTKLRKAEEQLIKAEKLSVVGELSASVAHEIRNPLTSLKGFVQLLQKGDHKNQFYYGIMSDELNRINFIVSELLLLAKPQHLKFETADVEKILSDCISLLKTEASMYDILIDFHPVEKELWMQCEPNQLKQLFINIIKNAIEASKKRDSIHISLGKTANDLIRVTVKDQGEGISKERLERLGEPFYSSKEKGTGLGLTVSFKIVETHHGTIKFDSGQQKGTSVEIELPIKKTIAATANQSLSIRNTASR